MAKRQSKKSAASLNQPEAGKVGSLANVGSTMIASEIVLRSIGRLTRRTVEKAVARQRHDPDRAEAIVQNRGLLHTLAAFGASRIATRSVPGALLVGGGLLAKFLFDRGAIRRKSRKNSKHSDDTKLR